LKWNNSCIDGTLKSLPCPKTINGTEQNNPQCVSALYRGGNGFTSKFLKEKIESEIVLSFLFSLGVSIYRHCANNISFRHDCDPPTTSTDFHKSEMSFYCRHACSFNGCNKHLAEEIISSGIRLLKTNHYIAFIFVYYRIFHTIYTLDLQVITS
jgi:hypothetical protein